MIQKYHHCGVYEEKILAAQNIFRNEPCGVGSALRRMRQMLPA
jgi:hypothetical protein